MSVVLSTASSLTPTTIGWAIAVLAILLVLVGIAAVVVVELFFKARIKRVAVRPGTFLAVAESVTNGRLLRRIPPVNVGHRIEDDRGSDNSVPEFEGNAASIAVALQGAEFVGATLTSWNAVSENIMAAVAQMTHKDIHSFADLFAAVHAKGYKLASDGFFWNLRGHAAEFQVAKDFAPWQPYVPTDSNNPAFDLGFGSHGVANVKVVSNAGPTLSNHFDQHPQVAAIINSDAANIPHDALYFNPAHGIDPSILDHANHLTIVDTTLSAAGIGAETSHAIDLLQHPINPHFPYIGLVVVSGSQVLLWSRGKKRAAHAIEDTAVISAGLIGGLKGGALGGAAIGTSIFPGVGTLVGGLVGGVGGLMTGKYFGVKFTQRRFREAERQAKARSVDLKLAFLTASNWADAEWKSTMENEQARLSSEIDAVAVQVKPALSRIFTRDERRNAEYLADIQSAVDNAQCYFNARLKSLEKWARINPLARQRYVESKQDFAAWEAFQVTAVDNISRLGDLLIAFPSQLKLATQLAGRLADIRTTYYAETQEVSATAIRKTLIARKTSVKRLNAAFDQLALDIEKRTEPERQSLFEAIEEFKYFKVAAGK